LKNKIIKKGKNNCIRNYAKSMIFDDYFRKMGEFVKFGEDVVFRHVDSLDYLSGSVRCSEGGLGAFKV
jgi:hypothetical protein